MRNSPNAPRGSQMWIGGRELVPPMAQHATRQKGQNTFISTPLSQFEGNNIGKNDYFYPPPACPSISSWAALRRGKRGRSCHACDAKGPRRPLTHPHEDSHPLSALTPTHDHNLYTCSYPLARGIISRIISKMVHCSHIHAYSLGYGRVNVVCLL